MKILLLSFHFPPDAPLAATRAPKLARYLLRAGCDVRVLTARDPQPKVAHALDFPEQRVIRTPWRDRRDLPSELLARVKAPSAQDNNASASEAGAPDQPTKPSRLKSGLRDLYSASLCRPDYRIGWKSYALEAAEALFAHWRPDLIYVTCPPHSSAVIADEIAQAHDIPFITEFRDRWAHDAYSDHPVWRQKLDARQERSVLSRAAGIVTVSDLWAESYAERYPGKPLVVAMNGFDPDDYPLDPQTQPNRAEELNLLYAGVLYPGRRDPKPVFDAIARLNTEGERVEVTMLGRDLELAKARAQESQIADQVSILPPEPHAEIVKRQFAADGLILLQWDDQRDAGTVPGKLFEYIAARRPIIATGYEAGVAARILSEQNFGTLSNDPERLAAAMRALIAKKRAAGCIEALPEAGRAGFERDRQFARLLPMFDQILMQRRPSDEFATAAE